MHRQHGGPGLQPALGIVEPAPADWDAFALCHPRGHLLQSAGWGALKERFGWRAQRIAVAGPGGLLAGAQLLYRSRLGLGVAYAPRGPLLAGDTAADELLLGALARAARRRRTVFLRLEPNLLEDDDGADALHTTLLLRGWRTAAPLQPRSTIHLDLRPPSEALLAACSKGHRADIRRSARQGIVVRAGMNAADLTAFYRMMEATSDRRAGFGIHSEAYYRAAWEIFSGFAAQDEGFSGPQAAARLLLAEQNGAVVAGFLVFAAAGQGLYLYSGSTEAGMRAGANHLLQWHAINWARERGCALYDMWGVPDTLGRAATLPDGHARAALEQAAQADPLHGVYRFKKGFGGRVVRYLPAYDQVYLPPLYALWRRRASG
jgi:lipid II:glycine glycyltransferase (peptidoglycan interpeptide bridge formation enzyme)